MTLWLGIILLSASMFGLGALTVLYLVFGSTVWYHAWWTDRAEDED